MESRLVWSTVLTFVALFMLGASRALVTVDRWWRSGLETLALGAVVAMTAYGAGRIGALVASRL